MSTLPTTAELRLPPVTLYESEWATVICGDARDALLAIPTEAVDCLVTDPPYGVQWQANTRREKFARIAGDGNAAAALALLADATPDLWRTLRRTRHAYTFGLRLEHPLFAVKADLVWDKARIGSGDLSCAWGPSHEPIYFHIRAADKTNAERGSGNLAARLRRGSVIRVPRPSAMQVKRHPTEKPIALLQQLIESSTMPGELVLDPFAGVGSTGVAAVLDGRRCILVELDPGYAAIAVERVRAAEKTRALGAVV